MTKMLGDTEVRPTLSRIGTEADAITHRPARPEADADHPRGPESTQVPRDPQTPAT